MFLLSTFLRDDVVINQDSSKDRQISPNFNIYIYIYGHFRNLNFRVNFNLSLKMRRIITVKHCSIVSIYKVEELEKWYRSNLFVPLASGRWYLFHENWIFENNGRRKDSKKWSETSPFAKRYEIETWLFFYHSVGRSKRQCGNICLGNIELQIRETFIVVMLSSPHPWLLRILCSPKSYRSKSYCSFNDLFNRIFVSLHFHVQMWRNYSR